MDLSAEHERFWHAYVASLETNSRPNGFVVGGQPGTTDIADEHIALYLSVRMTAPSGLVESDRAGEDPLPKAGYHWIALGSNGRPPCILRTDSVEIHPSAEMPERIAIAEGERDLSLAHWRRAHATLYEANTAELGLVNIEEATVVTEFFSLVHR